MEQSTVAVNTVDFLSVGHIQISLTDWTDGAEPEITSGSVLEIGGSIFYASGDDDLDVAGAWGGIANDTLVYIYYSVSGTTATAELSTTAPTWDDAKQGWYNAGATKRCVGSIYKDSGGNYDQKTIFLDQFNKKKYPGLQRLLVCENTGTQTIVFGAWRTISLNTESVNTIPGASLAADVITLPSGEYNMICHGVAIIGLAGDKAITRFRNTTDNVTIARCGYLTILNQIFYASFSITSVKTFELQAYVDSATSNGSIGGSTTAGGETFYYPLIEIIRNKSSLP